MTLIAALDFNRIPVLMGDLLVSQPGASIPHAPIPTVAKADLQEILPQEWWRPITGLTRKVSKINDALVIGWCDSRVTATHVLRKLKEQFGSEQVNRDQLCGFFANLENENFGTNHCILIGWLVDGSGPISFKWNSESKALHMGVHPYVEGSGAEDFFRNIQIFQTNYRGKKSTDLSSAIKFALGQAGNIIGGEKWTGQNLQALYGGGIETLYFADGRFHQLDNVAFLFWNLEIDVGRSLRLRNAPILMKYKYVHDFLLIKAVWLEDHENNIHREINRSELYVVAPVYTHRLDFNPYNTELNFSNSCYYCNFLFTQVAGYDIHLCATYEASDKNCHVRIRQLEGTKEAVEFNEQFLILLHTSLAPTILELTGESSIVFREASEEYWASLRSERPFMHQIFFHWGAELAARARNNLAVEGNQF